MKKIICLFISVCILTLSSCMDNSYEEILFRTLDDPFYDVPETDYLSLEDTIYLNWKTDEACDVFYLMRSVDSSTPDFKCIYSGSELSFTDTNVENEGRYLYRLDKKRGNKVFAGKTYSYAYASGTRSDASESNDTENSATHLEYDLSCNLTYIQYEYESFIYEDCDWFYVELPPNRTAEIIINQKNYLSDSSDGALTKLKYLVSGYCEESVLQNTGISLSNTSYETKKIYFRISADTTGLLTQAGSACVINYEISLNKIYK